MIYDNLYEEITLKNDDDPLRVSRRVERRG